MGFISYQLVDGIAYFLGLCKRNSEDAHGIKALRGFERAYLDAKFKNEAKNWPAPRGLQSNSG